MSTRKPYRNGRVHVCASMCATCIFKPGAFLGLAPGRVEAMVQEATRRESCIPCHETLDGLQAVCRGFYEKHPTAPLQIAQRLGMVEFQEVGK